MAADVVRRETESAAIAQFLDKTVDEPSSLLVEGEPGIGKTTLWLAAQAQARERGFRVLSTRGAETESVLAYAALADLLGKVDGAAFARLPDPQRFAIDGVLLRGAADGHASDQLAVAAGFLSVVEALADAAPVLLAIDDLQWVDASSLSALTSAARQFSGRVGVLATLRTDPANANDSLWPQLPRPDRISRITVTPLSLAGVRTVVSARLGLSFARPTMVRIHEVSGGNPFYALELAREMAAEPTGADAPLPSTLAELVRASIGRLDAGAGEVLLAAACLATPTVELVGRATGSDAGQVVELLADAEAKGVISVDGHRLQFTHPLLARGVVNEATPARRRRMHRRLAEIVDQLELRARHLALAATAGNPQTLQTLDAAADSARRRGAPAAAAELLELAMGLGGDTPFRRIALAEHLYFAGDPARARTLLAETIDALAPGELRAGALYLLAVSRLSEDDFIDASETLERGLEDAGNNPVLHAQMMVILSFAQANAGKFCAAVRTVEEAVAHAERLRAPNVLSQALGFRVMLGFIAGEGINEFNLARALELEESASDTPYVVRASSQNPLLLGWTGQLDQARQQLIAMRSRCRDRGEENDLIVFAFHSMMFAIWQGDFTDAMLIAEDAMERATQLDRDYALFAAHTMRGTIAAYAGRVDEARRDIGAALDRARRYGSSRTTEWPISALGFLEVSLGDYNAALTTLEPLMDTLAAAPYAMEMIAASFAPDAAEALIHVGRLADAEALIDRLEHDGGRLDRAWMLACGARCRAMLLAARGDIDAARVTAQKAMVEHHRLPMPFERARTQLLLGKLQRRLRRWQAGAATLREALGTFDELGTTLWADHARAELGRANVGPHLASTLTSSEQRVAELAASGMTNRDVAAALFISPKTVEANLARIYRKLDIHSRAELGRRMSHTDP